MNNNILKFLIFTLLIVLCGCTSTEHPVQLVLNPYESVRWGSVERHQGNFHTHTTQSDGRVDPHEVIDRYHALGHEVLALTDHNKSTWPWTDFDRNPDELGMVAVPGNELSRHHHTLSLFSDLENETRQLETSLEQIDETGGMSVLAHPGRYWKLEDGKVPDVVRDRYIQYYQSFDSLVAMEVVNQGDRYPMDRALWDAVLTELMPVRPVWGMANDDSHQVSHIGLNITELFLAEHTIETVRTALEDGTYYFTTVTSHPRNERDPEGIPVIHRIDHDKRSNVLTVQADCKGEPLPEDAFRWISVGGEEVAQGSALKLNEVEGLDKYVRAEIRGSGGTAYTQPFGLKRTQSAGNTSAGFRFAHVCDTQLGYGGYEHDIATFEQAVRQINDLDVDFAVICGDLVGHPKDEAFADFMRIRAKFEVPCYVVPGNHDVGNQPTAEKLAKYRELVGEDYFSFEHKGYTFVGVNTSLWKAPLDGETQKQNVWLNDVLTQAVSKEQGVFILGHYPLYTKQPDEEEHYYNLPVQTRHDLLNQFAESGVLAVLTGHAHRIIINDHEGMQLVTGQATSKTHKSPLGFRLWHIKGESPFEHESVDLEGIDT